jgi:hypothetical protein
MIAVPTVLVAFKRQAKSNRQRVPSFVDCLFSRIDRQQAPGFDPKWKSINLAATVPGLSCLSAAQDDSNVWRIRHIRSRRRLARQLGRVSDTTSPARQFLGDVPACIFR